MQKKIILPLFFFLCLLLIQSSFAANLNGRIRDTFKGGPVPGVNVIGPGGTTSSGGDGSYSLPLISGQLNEIHYSRDGGYKFFAPVSKILSYGPEDVTIDKYVDKVAIKGTIGDKNNGTPCVDIATSLTLQGISVPDVVPVNVLDGVIVSESQIRPGTYKAIITSPGYETSEQQIEIRDNLPVNYFDFRLVPNRINLKVVDDTGGAIGGAIVRIGEVSSMYMGKTTADGTIPEFAAGLRIPAGSYNILINPPDEKFAPYSGTISVVSGQDNNVTIILPNQVHRRIIVSQATFPALLAAIAEANAATQAVDVEFAPGLEGTISVTSPITLTPQVGITIRATESPNVVFKREIVGPAAMFNVPAIKATLWNLNLDANGGFAVDSTPAGPNRYFRMFGCKVTNPPVNSFVIRAQGTGIMVIDDSHISGRIDATQRMFLATNVISVGQEDAAALILGQAGPGGSFGNVVYKNSITGAVRIAAIPYRFENNSIDAQHITTSAVDLNHGQPAGYIVGNTIRGGGAVTDRGICFADREAVIVSGNIISNVQYGIKGPNIDTSKTIFGNTISNFGKSGIDLHKKTGALSLHMANLVDNKISDQTGNSGAAIYLGEICNSFVQANNIRNAVNGIVCDNLTDLTFSMRFINNTCSGLKDTGLLFTGVCNNVVSNNNKMLNNSTGIRSLGTLNAWFIDDVATGNSYRDWDLQAGGTVRLFRITGEDTFFSAKPAVIEASYLGNSSWPGEIKPAIPQADYKICVNRGTYRLNYISDKGNLNMVTHNYTPLQLGAFVLTATSTGSVSGNVVSEMLTVPALVQLEGTGGGGFSDPLVVNPTVLNPIVKPDISLPVNYILLGGQSKPQDFWLRNAGNVDDRFYVAVKLDNSNWDAVVESAGQDITSRIVYRDTIPPLADRYLTSLVRPGEKEGFTISLKPNKIEGAGTASLAWTVVSATDNEEKHENAFKYEIMTAPQNVQGDKPGIIVTKDTLTLYFNRQPESQASSAAANAFAASSLESATILIYNLSGDLVSSQVFSLNTSGTTVVDIDKSKLVKGVYVYQLVEHGTVTARGKIAITQ